MARIAARSALLAFLLAAGPQAAQRPTPSPAPQQAPTFRSSTDTVRLDVSVLDADRKPIRGLKASDFRIRENGIDQEVVVFDPVELPDEVKHEATWHNEADPDVATNEPADGRIFILMLDDATARTDMWAFNAVKRIGRSIVEKIDPSDRMAVVFPLHDFNATDFTNSRARLLKTIDDYDLGFYDQGKFKQSEMNDANKGVALANKHFESGDLKTIRNVVDLLKNAPEKRRLLVYVGFGFNGSTLEVTPVLEEAQRAGVRVYSFNSCGLPGLEPCIVGLVPEKLAFNTSGQKYVQSNDFEPGIKQMFVENRSYYLIGYRTTTPAATSYRRIEVTVNQPDVVVMTRSGYFLEDEQARAKAVASGAKLRPPAAAVSGILPKVDLPLRITAAPFAQPGKAEASVLLVLATDLADLVVPVSGRVSDSVDVEVRAFTRSGLPKGQWRDSTTVNIRATRRTTPRAEVLSVVNLKPGRYTLRVGAHSDALGQSGSVYADIEVPDFAQAPLSMSGIVLGSDPRPSFAGDKSVAALVPLVPTAERTLSPSSVATAFVRIYQGGRGALVPVRVERRLLDAGGNPVDEATETLDAARFGNSRAADLSIRLPMAKLTKGAHVLRVTATIGEVTVARDLVFRVE